MGHRSLVPLLLIASLAVPRAARAQRPGRVEGDITDSLHSRPLPGATVLLSGLAPGSTAFHSAVADDRGRFRFDSVDAGRYSVTLSHPIIDSLELVLPPHEVTVTAGERSRITLALPSGATVRARACPGIAMPLRVGAIVGQVTDAESEQPLSNATIAVDWMDMQFDRSTLQTTSTPRSASIRTDSTGIFRFCGVPTDTYVLLQVQRDGRSGSPVRVSIPVASGLTVLRLSYSESASRPLAAAEDSAGADEVVPLTGTASVGGVVRNTNGQPVNDAVVRLVGAAGESRTDGRGAFSLAALPAGTQLLEVRRVGYLVAHERVELRSGRTVTADVALQRIVTLDSVRVIAQRNRYREAADRQRRQGGAGTYITEDQIARYAATETTDLLSRLGSLFVQGRGLDAKLYVQRGAKTIEGPPCPMNVIIDGFQHQDANVVLPQEIGAIEIYKGPAGAPIEFNSACGVVMIWTKR
jgi:hypothetical protein